MKITNYFAFTGLLLFGITCSEREMSVNESSYRFSSKPTPYPTPCYIVSTEGSQNNLFPDLKAISLANGINTNSSKNILIFPSMESYQSTIETLEMQVESHNNAFDQLTNGMSDIEAEAYADSIGFDDDKPITDFENTFQFGSLRKKLNALEDQWLNQQVDGNWNLDTDPDSYYIDDDVERALLNEQSEVLIGTCETGYTLYKFYNWGYVHLPVGNFNELSNVLVQLNNGNYPLSLPININGSSLASVNAILDNSSFVCQTITTSESCFITTDPTNDTVNDCQETVKNKGEHVFNSERRIKWKHKFIKLKNYGSGGGVYTRAKSVTKSFRKKNGKWKPFKAAISAGVSGKAYENCSTEKQVNEDKQKRRKRVKMKTDLQEPAGTSQKNKVKSNSLFSVHKQEGNIYEKDIYQY